MSLANQDNCGLPFYVCSCTLSFLSQQAFMARKHPMGISVHKADAKGGSKVKRSKSNVLEKGVAKAVRQHLSKSRDIKSPETVSAFKVGVPVAPESESGASTSPNSPSSPSNSSRTDMANSVPGRVGRRPTPSPANVEQVRQIITSNIQNYTHEGLSTIQILDSHPRSSVRSPIFRFNAPTSSNSCAEKTKSPVLSKIVLMAALVAFEYVPAVEKNTFDAFY